MAIIKQGILGGFKKKCGSVVGSSWKGIATMRSLPLSVANPKTAAQVDNRNRFKACSGFASEILSATIKPLMDRFAGQMSGYNYFCKLNKEVWSNPSEINWGDLLISKGRMLPPSTLGASVSGTTLTVQQTAPAGDRYALPTDKIYLLVCDESTDEVVFQGDTGKTRSDANFTVTLSKAIEDGNDYIIFFSYLRTDGSEVSTSIPYGDVA